MSKALIPEPLFGVGIPKHSNSVKQILVKEVVIKTIHDHRIMKDRHADSTLPDTVTRLGFLSLVYVDFLLGRDIETE